MKESAPSYYDAESLAMTFVDYYDGECYTECHENTLYILDTTTKEVILEIIYK